MTTRRTPRFIETVPRRGYRFIAPVEQVASASFGADFTTVEDVAKGAGYNSIQQEKIARQNRVRRSRVRWMVGMVVGVASCVTVFAWFTASTESSPKILRAIPITSDGRQKITDNPNFPSPLVTDGARIYFQETILGHVAIAQAAATEGETELLSTPFRDVQLLGISPDHANVLIADVRSQSSLESALFNLPVIGGTAKRLGDFVAHDATWSPSGTSLVYATYATNDELQIADQNGGHPHRLVSGIGIPWWPRWTPDSRIITFTTTDTKTQSSSIWEVRPDGSHLRPILSGWNDPPTNAVARGLPTGKIWCLKRPTTTRLAYGFCARTATFFDGRALLLSA